MHLFGLDSFSTSYSYNEDVLFVMYTFVSSQKSNLRASGSISYIKNQSTKKQRDAQFRVAECNLKSDTLDSCYTLMIFIATGPFGLGPIATRHTSPRDKKFLCGSNCNEL